MMKNLICISIDNLRYDCVGYQPDKRELERHDVVKLLNTPALDSIAEKSLCFSHCFSTSSYTTASHASILTGLYPPRHGVRAFYGTKLDAGVVTLAELLQKQGYRTVLYTDIMDLFVPLDLHRGFEFLVARDDMKLFSLLKDLSGDKIFLFSHFFDVHEPFLHNTNQYAPGVNDDFYQEMARLYREYHLADFEKREDSAELWNRLVRGPLASRPIEVLLPLYVRGVTKFDQGRFNRFMESLSGLGILQDAVTAVFSDHGEGRCSAEDKNYLSHGGLLYDNVIRIPLMISHPDIKPGVNDSLTSSVDIFATVLHLLGIEPVKTIDGICSLTETRDSVYAETWGSTGSSIYATTQGTLTPATSQWPEFYLKEMAFRTVNEKYVIMNNRDNNSIWDADKRGGLSQAENLSDAEFVEKLYGEILCRASDSEGKLSHVRLLESQAVTRPQLTDAFLNSEEFKSALKYHLYDLRTDPEENTPEDYSDRYKTISLFGEMISQNGKAVRTPSIFSSCSRSCGHAEAKTPSTDKTSVSAALSKKEEMAREVLGRAIGLYGVNNIAVAWTGGKDSTTVLSLVRDIFDGSVPLKVINIDTTVKFPEIYAFRDRLTKEWKLDVAIVNNDEAIQWLKTAKDHAECCYQLKTLPLNRAIQSLHIKALITGVRWDEQSARSEEDYFSPRESPAHVRVQPILHFTEADIWEYIREHRLPFCELYDRGYRSLGCAPCTSLSATDGPERSGRARDKEEIMARLRELGYF